MSADQADDVLSHRDIGEVAAAHPSAIEDQTLDPARCVAAYAAATTAPSEAPTRSTRLVPAASTTALSASSSSFIEAVGRSRQAAPGPVVAHERSAPGEQLVVATLRRHRPAQLEVRQPPGDVDQWRAVAHPGEGHVRPVAELDRVDRLFQRPESASAHCVPPLRSATHLAMGAVELHVSGRAARRLAHDSSGWSAAPRSLPSSVSM